MKLKQIAEACAAKKMKEEEEFSKITNKDYTLWVNTLKDMVEEEGMDFEEALDTMLDNDPKFEALKQSQQRSVVKKIRDLFDRTAAE